MMVEGGNNVVVRRVKRMRLFGVNINVKMEERKLIIRLFGNDICAEEYFDISTDHHHHPLYPPAALPSLAARRCFKISPLAIPAVAHPYYDHALSKESIVPATPPRALRVPAATPTNINTVRRSKTIKIRIIPPRQPQPQPQPPQLPVQVRTAIETLGGTQLVFLTSKKVEISDTDRRLNRLFIPKEAESGILKALTAEEKGIMGIRGDKVEKTNKRKKNGGGGGRVEGKLGVRVVDGNGNVHQEMEFTKWPSLGKLVFLKKWYDFAKESELEGSVDSIQLWCFRDADSRLCFVVAKIN